MIDHALIIVRNELEAHLAASGNSTHAELGNVGEIGQPGAQLRDKVLLSVVNLQEERTLKNTPAHVRDDVQMRVRYENPPTFLNLAVLLTATHTDYINALRALSRALLFFQHRNVLTQDNVAPNSISHDAPPRDADRLTEFKLIFNLWSPTFEEVNDMWGMLGGKQFPFALYSVRMLELKFRAIQRESGLITEVVSSFGHKAPVS
jgi:Pvc16 N-terminal domain